MSSDGKHRPPMLNGDKPRTGFGVSAAEIKAYSNGKMCGNCAYFEPGHAVAEMARTQFMPKLVKELEWKPHHLGAALTGEGGLCGAKSSGADKMITATFTVGCEEWREDRGRMKRQASDQEQASWHEQRRRMLRLNAERMKNEREKHLRRIGVLKEK